MFWAAVVNCGDGLSMGIFPIAETGLRRVERGWGESTVRGPPHPMKSIETILSRHPFPSGSTLQAALVPALQALGACVEACTSCADACLAEQGVDHLRRCIRLNLDCADICMTTARILARQTETVGDLLHAQLHACVLACAQCADECHRHRKMHEHCLHCERHCRECQEACNLLIGELTSAGITPAAESDDV